MSLDLARVIGLSISSRARMVFYLVGLGLGSERDITVKGLEIVKRCAKVYLEAYTAILSVPASTLVCNAKS